jgi:hypothetical protein
MGKRIFHKGWGLRAKKRSWLNPMEEDAFNFINFSRGWK